MLNGIRWVPAVPDAERQFLTMNGIRCVPAVPEG
jgi:hypothetical protein